MGLQDRDWYREEYRKRTAARDPGTDWYDPRQFRQARVAGGGGTTMAAAMSLIRVLGALSAVLLLVRHGLNDGWVDRALDAASGRQLVVFPESGAVSVMPAAMNTPATARFSISGDPERHSVLRLTRADTSEYVMSIYIRRGEQANVPVPAGRYRLDIASGRNWYGRKAMFGFDERLERVAKTFEMWPAVGTGIDLRRRIGGNLHTVVEGKGAFHEQAVQDPDGGPDGDGGSHV